jgi:hypothetical protein
VIWGSKSNVYIHGMFGNVFEKFILLKDFYVNLRRFYSLFETRERK